MKHSPAGFRHAVLIAAALFSATLESSAQLTVSWTNTFDTASSMGVWDYWFGTQPSWSPISWSTNDAAGNPASGSLAVSIPWNTNANGQYWVGYWNQDNDGTVAMLGAYITNISFDIHVDPSSPLSTAGNFGALQVGFNPGAIFWTSNTVTLPSSATNGWMHVSIPVATNTVGMVPVQGLTMDMNKPAGVPLNSTTLFYIDNIRTAATPNYTNSFNTNNGDWTSQPWSSPTGWIYFQGLYYVGAAMGWSGNVDANGNPNSGSLEASIQWTGGTNAETTNFNVVESPNYNPEGALLFQSIIGAFANRYAFDNGQTTSGFNFQSIRCSVLVDPSSPMNAAGNYGVLQIGFVSDVPDAHGNWSTITWPASSVTLQPSASSGWTNIVVPIDYSTPGLGSVSGIFLQMQTGPAQGGGLPGTTLFWVDNIGMAAATGPTALMITNVSQSDANVVIDGLHPNGKSSDYYVILSSPNLSLPLAQWTPVATNQFNTNGTFSYTNGINSSQSSEYYTFILTNAGILGPGTSFTMSTNLGVAPFTVSFTDTSTKNPTSWFWTFGDGSTSTAQNPSYTFTNIWRQTVTLTASNAYGANSCSQPVFQCFPCDALYDWTGGVQGQVATVAMLSNSLAPGGNTLGRFTTTNEDWSSPNLQGMIFTNLPGMTNGCPVVFSNGVIDGNFNTTNALAYTWTNAHEIYMFMFNSGLVVTDLVELFYTSLPETNGGFGAAEDTRGFVSEGDNPILGSYVLNRNIGWPGTLMPGELNDTVHMETTPSDPGSFPGSPPALSVYPNKLYRILMEENTNGNCTFAIADPETSSFIGFITNFNITDLGRPITGFNNGHISWEQFTGKFTSIQACHDIICVNRPLTWSQVSNVVMYGP